MNETHTSYSSAYNPCFTTSGDFSAVLAIGGHLVVSAVMIQYGG